VDVSNGLLIAVYDLEAAVAAAPVIIASSTDSPQTKSHEPLVLGQTFFGPDDVQVTRYLDSALHCLEGCGGTLMNKALRVAVAAAIGITSLSLTAPAQAGGSAVGAGILGFGIRALLGSLLTPSEVYVVPAPYYYGPVVYDPPPPYYYYEYHYYGPPPGKPRLHNHRPPHATPTAHDKSQPRTAKARQANLSP